MQSNKTAVLDDDAARVNELFRDSEEQRKDVPMNEAIKVAKISQPNPVQPPTDNVVATSDKTATEPDQTLDE